MVFAPDWHSTESTVLDEQQRPVGFEDAACAVRFARAKAPEYGGDPSHLVVVGHSAGGASGAAITLAGDDFQGDCLVEGGSALPDAFVGLDGAYELPKYASPSRVEQNPEAWQTVNPYTYVNRGPIRNGVRFYLYAGSEQELVGVAQRLAAALQAAGYPAMFKEFSGDGPHEHGHLTTRPGAGDHGSSGTWRSANRARDHLPRGNLHLSRLARQEGKKRLRLIRGDKKILPGIEVLLVPGHTVGLQAVAVNTAKGTAIVGSDLAHTFASYKTDIPSAIITDMIAWMKSFDKAKAKASSPELLFPGHDVALMEDYPKAAEDITRLA